jgi:hypothetical protein
MPIQVSNYRQQVIINTLTNTFVTVHTNTVTDVETFILTGVAYRLGQLGKSFRTNFSEQVNTPGAVPSGWFAGTSTGSKNSRMRRDDFLDRVNNRPVKSARLRGCANAITDS